MVWACLVGPVQAETRTFTYDALGRLKWVGTTGGPGDGTWRGYQYDHAGNRTQFTTTTNTPVVGTTIQATRNVVNVVSAGAVLTMDVAGLGPLTGMVTFTENGTFLGSTYVIDGQASILLEGLPLGVHTITVSYPGDGVNEAYSRTFTIRVQNLSWLPSMLDLILQ
jgi:hypothetical protein